MKGYEPSDANIRSVVLFGVGLFAAIVLVLFGMNRLFHYLVARDRAGTVSSPFALMREIPPLPRLQVFEAADQKKFRESEESVLRSYGWVDRDAGVVRIPIDRAIELLAERRLLSRGGKERQFSN